MCNFVSEASRVVRQRKGTVTHRVGCFQSYALGGSSAPVLHSGFCEFHQHSSPVTLPFAGASPAKEFEERLSRYIGDETLLNTTLDLVGLEVSFRNGRGPISTLIDVAREHMAEIESVLLDEAALHCSDALVDVEAPSTSFSFVGTNFLGSLDVHQVTCRRLDFKNAKFQQRCLKLTGVTCDTVELSGVKLERLTLLNCKIGKLLITDSDVSSLDILEGVIGAERTPNLAEEMGLFASWNKSDQGGQINHLTLKASNFSGTFDLTGRQVKTALSLIDVRLSCPIHVSRDFLVGDIEVQDVETEHNRTQDKNSLRQWVRMFSEIKAASLSVGDRATWANFAIREQEARLHQEADLVHKLIFGIDGFLSKHGTDLIRSFGVLVMQMIVFMNLYILIDEATGRWSEYKSFSGYISSKFVFSISQTVRPFSAFEEDLMGHPYVRHAIHSEWLHFVMLMLALCQSAVCVAIFASAILALRHRISSLAW
jgi:hypothetical protein